MFLQWRQFFVVLFFSFFAAAQTGGSDSIFTILVAPPTSAKDVQVRYLLTDDSGSHRFSTRSHAASDKVIVQNGPEGGSAMSLRAIVYAPGCQFGTIEIADLAAGNRQGDFACKTLGKTQLRGRTTISGFAQKDLQVEAFYVIGWAGQFFEIPGGAVSPISVATGSVQPDGSFTVDLPDFPSDPLWASLSNNATLMFVLVDKTSGQRLATLSPPEDLSSAGSLKIASTYPEVEFSVQLPTGKSDTAH